MGIPAADLHANQLARELREASQRGDAPAIALLLAAGADPDRAGEARDAFGSALAIAASMGHLDCARLLLPASDPNLADDAGLTPLMQAAGNNHAGCVELLLPRGDASLADARGFNALMRAAERASLECLRLLAPASPVDAVCANGKFTALWLLFDHPDLCASDIERRGRALDCFRVLAPLCDLRSPRNPRHTALLAALISNTAALVEIFAPFSDLLSRDAEGFTPFSTALAWGHFGCADAMAPWLPEAELREAFEASGVGKKADPALKSLLPRSFARWEAQQIELVVSPAQPAPGAHFAPASPESQAPAPPSARPKTRPRAL